MQEIKRLFKVSGILIALCVLGLVLSSKIDQAISFLIGVLFSMINFLVLAYISKKILDGKSLVIPIFLAVNKYLLVFVGLYYILQLKSISLPWFIFGLMILVPSVMLYGFILFKNQGYLKNLKR